MRKETVRQNVACPTCAATIGENCFDENEYPSTKNHLARDKAYREMVKSVKSDPIKIKSDPIKKEKYRFGEIVKDINSPYSVSPVVIRVEYNLPKETIQEMTNEITSKLFIMLTQYFEPVGDSSE